MKLLYLTLLLIFAGILIPPVLVLAGLSLLVFGLTTVPFVAKAWAKDTAVALTSPFFLFGRALALGLGYFFGGVRPLPSIQQMTTIEK